MPGLVARVHTVIVWESSENAGPWNALNLATEARACDDLARCQSKKSAWLSFFVCSCSRSHAAGASAEGHTFHLPVGLGRKPLYAFAATGWVGDESSAACSDLC